jgi:GPH family glycoside/pentoside/hexuronide:cation symporter
MTPDYDERTNITAFRSFFQNLFSLVTGWILAAAALPMFSSLPGGKPDLANGMRYVSLLLAVVTIILGIVPGLFVKERLFLDAGKKQARQGILAGLKMTLSRRPFLWLIVIVLCNTFGFGVVSTVGFYLNAYYVCAGDIALATHIQGAKSTALFLPTLLAIPFFTWFSHRFDKKAVLYLVIGMAITGYLSVYLCYTPRHPWLQILPSFLIGPSNLGLVMILPAMQADIADYDELQTGQRREGSFSAVFSWAYKASVTMTVGLAGVLLVATGFNIKLGAAQHPDVLMHLKLCYIWLPISLTLVGVCAVYQYNLTRQKMMEIRQLLEFKRGAA